MRHHRKLTDEERRQIIEARAEGTPAAVLAHRFGVSTRTIYNTLSRAKGAHLALTTTISTRLSARQLAGFQAALARRGITDHPAALRRLMGAADILLRPVDPVVLDHLQAWGEQVATKGAAVNQIARKLNEAAKAGRWSDATLPMRIYAHAETDEAAVRARFRTTHVQVAPVKKRKHRKTKKDQENE